MTDTELPEILVYNKTDAHTAHGAYPLFLARAHFIEMLDTYRPAVLAHLNEPAPRPAGPAKPTWVDVLQPDGTRVAGAVASHRTQGSTGGDGSGAGDF